MRLESSTPVLPSILLFLVGCAAHPDPIIDTKGVDEETLAVDWDECEAYTEEIVIAQGAAKGAAAGAAVGAVSGAINGDVSRASANAALYGGTRSALDADRQQQQVFKRCMRLRGYRVLN